jgi:ArsR family transcriptional regulator
LLRALAHPIRLQILDILKEGECCVCHLTTVLKQRQPYVSQQLMVLREARLVLDRKEGVIVYYRLADQHLVALMESAREMLRATGCQVERVAIPVAPVSGCPCPKCNPGVSQVT